MPIQFLPLEERLLPLTRAFNARMLAGKAPIDFYLPDGPGRPADHTKHIQQEHVIAVDGASARGGFIDAVYPGWLKSTETTLTNVSGILSEGLIDKNYLMLPAQMVKSFVKRDPHTFVVGMGGTHMPLPRLLKSAAWTVETIPFFFRMCRPARVLRELQPLQQPLWKKFAAQTAAVTGGAIAIHGIQALRGARGPDSGTTLQLVTSFGSWADGIWETAREDISVSVVRNASVLEELYPPGDARLRRYLITSSGQPFAWAVALLAPYQNHKYFGNLTVGVILDALGKPGVHTNALRLITAALAAENADLVVANFSHSRWCAAFRAAGFWPGPSNYLFAASPALAKACNGAPVASGLVHFTRGDGDGRVNL
ncbi:MAG: hypothetical protein M3Z23_18460 [Acidobacteriota bacterium]|nr:hypothetical protein [Acidobacteriota bacterium]